MQYNATYSILSKNVTFLSFTIAKYNCSYNFVMVQLRNAKRNVTFFNNIEFDKIYT